MKAHNLACEKNELLSLFSDKVVVKLDLFHAVCHQQTGGLVLETCHERASLHTVLRRQIWFRNLGAPLYQATELSTAPVCPDSVWAGNSVTTTQFFEQGLVLATNAEFLCPMFWETNVSRTVSYPFSSNLALIPAYLSSLWAREALRFSGVSQGTFTSTRWPSCPCHLGWPHQACPSYHSPGLSGRGT